jgi:chromosome partitioning protein
MMVVCIANQKGGVGKSTTAHALGVGLNEKGKRVLLVDLDPQANISYTAHSPGDVATAYDVMMGTADIKEAIVHTHSFDLLPASRGLSRMDLELSKTGKEYRLSEALEPITKQYDYVIIDTPPALGILTVNALTASDRMVIPTQADSYSLQGIGQLMETVDAVRRYTNKGLKLFGILLVRYNKRTILSRDMAEVIEATAQKVGTFLYESVIRECVALKEAQAKRTDIYSYAPKSNATIDYQAFVDEFLRRSVR